MKEVVTRGLSGALYAFLLILSIFLNEYVFLGLIFIFGLICIHELQRLLKLESYLSYVLLVIFFLVFSIFKWNIYAQWLLWIVTFLVKILLIKDLMTFNKIPLFEGKKYILIIFYLIASVIFITLIPYYNQDYHPEVLLGIFALMWANDTFAYLVGKNFGKRKLFERISPKKTIEGFMGGLIFSLLLSLLAHYITKDFTYLIWLGIGLLVSVFGTYGDLIQSKLKRQAQVKDSGTLMPGHGGLLDRLDSILFTSTFVYGYLLIIQYVS